LQNLSTYSPEYDIIDTEGEVRQKSHISKIIEEGGKTVAKNKKKSTKLKEIVTGALVDFIVGLLLIIIDKVMN